MKKLIIVILLFTSCVKIEVNDIEPQQVCKEGYNLTLIIPDGVRYYNIENWISADSINNSRVSYHNDRISIGNYTYTPSELTTKCF